MIYTEILLIDGIFLFLRNQVALLSQTKLSFDNNDSIKLNNDVIQPPITPNQFSIVTSTISDLNDK